MFDFGIGMGTAILGSSILSGVGSLIGGNAQANAAEDAANAATKYYDTNIGYLQPWMSAGTTALPQLESIAYGGESSPLYKMQAREGSKGINRELAARGLSNSGAGLESLRNFYSGLGANEAEKQYGRIFDLANLGYGATGQAVNTGENAARNLMSAYTQKGQATSDMYSGFANSILGGTNSYMDILGGNSGQTSPTLASNIAKADSYFGW